MKSFFNLLRVLHVLSTFCLWARVSPGADALRVIWVTTKPDDYNRVVRTFTITEAEAIVRAERDVPDELKGFIGKRARCLIGNYYFFGPVGKPITRLFGVLVDGLNGDVFFIREKESVSSSVPSISADTLRRAERYRNGQPIIGDELR
jgi:hypothetical protein